VPNKVITIFQSLSWLVYDKAKERFVWMAVPPVKKYVRAESVSID
jgi:hypothetical protein